MRLRCWPACFASKLKSQRTTSQEDIVKEGAEGHGMVEMVAVKGQGDADKITTGNGYSTPRLLTSG
jgi:hypothetical protein